MKIQCLIGAAYRPIMPAAVQTQSSPSQISPTIDGIFSLSASSISEGNYDSHQYAVNLVSDITFTKNIKLGFNYDFVKIEQANDLAPVRT